MFYEVISLFLHFNTKRLSITLIIFIFMIAIISFIYIQNALGPMDSSASEEEVIITIPSGSTTIDIAELLYENELIKNKVVFQYYIQWKNVGAKLQAGKYSMSKRMSIEEIVQDLIMGKTIKETYRFTIPEGYTVEQIATLLPEQGLGTKEQFLELAKVSQEQEIFDFNFLQEALKQHKVEYKLEGYLFPNTYEVKKDASEKEILTLLLHQFEKQWHEDWNQVLLEKEMTLHQLVTIASLVEREATVEKERAIIAGVIYNRIKEKMNLQIDATIQYILGEQKSRLMYEDLKIDHPYNTYLYTGLPPGPIANPGIESIKAAIFPQENSYLFYVTKKDGTGEHYFAKTYEEHLNNIEKSNQNVR